MNTTHSENALIVIDNELRSLGITEYRFCIENDCYVCEKFGHFFSVCKRQHSKTGNLIEKYKVTPLNGSVDR